MGYHRITDEEREKDPFGRFEIICERYYQGNERTRQIILDALAPEERQTFLLGAGLYHLFRDQRLYDSVHHAMAHQIYEEFHRKENAK